VKGALAVSSVKTVSTVVSVKTVLIALTAPLIQERIQTLMKTSGMFIRLTTGVVKSVSAVLSVIIVSSVKTVKNAMNANVWFHQRNRG